MFLFQTLGLSTWIRTLCFQTLGLGQYMGTLQVRYHCCNLFQLLYVPTSRTYVAFQSIYQLLLSLTFDVSPLTFDVSLLAFFNVP